MKAEEFPVLQWRPDHGGRASMGPRHESRGVVADALARLGAAKLQWGLGMKAEELGRECDP